LGNKEEMAKRHKDEDLEIIRTQYTVPRPLFFPNDEIFKACLICSISRLIKLFHRGACGSVTRKERTQGSANGGRCEDLFKNRETLPRTIEGRK